MVAAMLAVVEIMLVVAETIQVVQPVEVAVRRIQEIRLFLIVINSTKK